MSEEPKSSGGPGGSSVFLLSESVGGLVWFPSRSLRARDLMDLLGLEPVSILGICRGFGLDPIVRGFSAGS